MILVYLDIDSSRIDYTIDFIFRERGLEYKVVRSLEQFEGNLSRSKIAYCTSYTGNATWIPRATIMEECVVRACKVEKATLDALEFLSFDGQIDPIASIFYILTRYEEYTVNKRDEHGRFRFQDSILKVEWISQAVCDRWSEYVIQRIHPQWTFKNGETEIIPTFDIDNTFAYRLKEGFRMWSSIAKDVFLRNHARIRERKSVLLGSQSDPYDTFDKIKMISEKFPSTTVFWLVGKWAKKDRNISIAIPEHQKVIEEMSELAEIGLHPSYASFLNAQTIQLEKRDLENVVKHDIRHSRQHFLRFKLPETFQGLVENGFEHEWSMGFAEHIGFRCGTARAFPWFDLSTNSRTDLMIHPFVYMDGTLNEYMRLTPEQSKEKIQALYDEVHRYGGDFVFLWHNETIGDYGNWKGWSEVLNFTLNLKNEQK